MTFKELVAQLTVGNVAVGIAILLSLIQISPLKLNPWDKLLAWFGKKLNGATIKKLEELQKQVRDMWINTHRQSILTFARGLLRQEYCQQRCGQGGYGICPGLVSGT